MDKPLRVLIVEDSADDVILLMRELRRAGFQTSHKQVDTAEAMHAALDEQAWDLIICDYSMPRFSALAALEIVQKRELDLPFIIVSGAIGDDVAVAAMRAGAHDYLMKGNLKRLAPAIERELQEAAMRRERRQAEVALRQAQKMESLGLLAGSVAHDFNNLLVAMLGQSSLALARLEPGSAAREHVRKVVRAAERAADLTRQMLAYSGGGRFDVRVINLNQIIRDNLHLLEVAVPKRVSLQARLAPSLPRIDADPGRIQQVVMNLILNAAQAIGDRPGAVTLETAQAEGRRQPEPGWVRIVEPPGNGRFVTLTAIDTGVGMDAETLARIFEPFFTTKPGGKGLGLASMISIVREYRGGLYVRSAPELGTTFRLFFPASDSLEPEREDDDSIELVTPTLIPLGAVLVIDDESPVREAVSDILALVNVPVLAAPDGDTGLALFRERRDEVMCVLLDLSMPGLSGAETFSGLQALDDRVPIILSSGYSQAEVTARFGAMQPAAFIQKPYRLEALLSTIRDVCQFV